MDVVLEANPRDRDIAIRLAAVEALAKIDSPEQDMTSRLLGLLDDTCSQVRWSTRHALLEILVNRVSVATR